jgi:hypothetical protein
MALDTLKVARRLREARFTEGGGGRRSRHRGGLAALRAELRAEIAELRGELRQSELRLEAKLEAIKADILNRVFALIFGALVVNIIAIVGAVLAAPRLAGH